MLSKLGGSMNYDQDREGVKKEGKAFKKQNLKNKILEKVWRLYL